VLCQNRAADGGCKHEYQNHVHHFFVEQALARRIERLICDGAAASLAASDHTVCEDVHLAPPIVLGHKND
jgi:hypothetical protein